MNEVEAAAIIHQIDQDLASLVWKHTEKGIDGRLIYFAIRGIERALATEIERQFGPQEVAAIQQGAAIGVRIRIVEIT